MNIVNEAEAPDHRLQAIAIAPPFPSPRRHTGDGLKVLFGELTKFIRDRK